MKYHSLLAIICFSVSVSFAQSHDNKTYPITIAIHGGAGYMKKENFTPEQEAQYHASLQTALKTGYDILEKGGTSLDAVEATIKVLEDDSLFNSGRGAVLTREGRAELDASIMNGEDRKAGAVTGLTTVRHPISAARKVMEATPHVLLSGEGAEKFCKEQNLEIVDPSFFITTARLNDWKKQKTAEEEKAKVKGKGGSVSEPEQPWKFGTVGCVAMDRLGNLAAGTSTGGMQMKMFGRIGDSPIIGAGTYANNKTCAVSCTGHGEYFIRYAVAHDISALMEYKNMSLKDAARAVIQDKLKPAGGTGGIVAIDRNGKIVFEFNTPGMFRGYLQQGSTVKTFIFGED